MALDRTAEAEPANAIAGVWRSYHLVYYGDHDQVLGALIAPLVCALWTERAIDRFFFIRYTLGGPHLRLRLRVVPGRASAVAQRVESATAGFFARSPSTTVLNTERIQRGNRLILALDPHELDNDVYPDNSVQEVPFRPEVERYGGPQLLPCSLDAFTLSSVAALRFLASLHGQPRSRLLSGALRLLARSVWSFAADPGESAEVLGAFIGSRGLTLPLEHGDRAYERQRESFRQLVRSEIEALAESGPSSAWTRGLCVLSRQLRDADPTTRQRIGWSHLHMTANRIGLANPEEVYVGRILERATAELTAAEPDWWAGAWQALGERRQAAAGEWLDDLVQGALEEHSATMGIELSSQGIDGWNGSSAI